MSRTKTERGTTQSESLVAAEQHWDVFISHANEDKSGIAAPLANALRKKRISVWYDEFSLKIGDSLRESIDTGLNRCRFGIVILSKYFFEKRWPIRELNGLATREWSGEKVILPVWHQVSFDEVRRFSPMLADRYALKTSIGIQHLADEIILAIQETGSGIRFGVQLFDDPNVRLGGVEWRESYFYIGVGFENESETDYTDIDFQVALDAHIIHVRALTPLEGLELTAPNRPTNLMVETSKGYRLPIHIPSFIPDKEVRITCPRILKRSKLKLALVSARLTTNLFCTGDPPPSYLAPRRKPEWLKFRGECRINGKKHTFNEFQHDFSYLVFVNSAHLNTPPAKAPS
jgi:hypothetical protein